MTDIFMMIFLNTDAWKQGGLLGFVVFSCVGAIGAVWKFSTSRMEKVENFFLEEKSKLEKRIKEDAQKIEELNSKILSIREEYISQLERANSELQNTNNLLRERNSKN